MLKLLCICIICGIYILKQINIEFKIKILKFGFCKNSYKKNQIWDRCVLLKYTGMYGVFHDDMDIEKWFLLLSCNNNMGS